MSEQSDNRQSAQGSYIAQASGGSTAIVANYEYAPPRGVDAETLEKARRQLEELPLEEVPSPAPPPYGSRMPLNQNPLFVGREEQLKALARSFKSGARDLEGRIITVAATGIGGVGKSQLASEFVHRYGQYFSGGVFWFSFAEATDVPAEVAKSGGAGGPELGSDFGSLALEDRVLRVMSAWQSPLPRLLVFDNCEEEDLLARWRPPAGGCRVLLTCRREIWDPRLGVTVVRLDVLSREESVALLGQHRPDFPEDDPNLDAIAGELGDLPLALELAGSFLARYRRVVSPSDYLAQLRSPELLRHPSLRQAEGGISPFERERDVARTFALSYEQLHSEDPIDALAVALLARAALFAPGEPIPYDLLVKSLEVPDDGLEALLRAQDALLRLTELGMLQEQKAGAQRMHRLVAAFVRGVVGDEARPAVEEALLKITGDLVNRGYPNPLLPVLPHLRAVTDAARDREDERAASLCHQLGTFLQKALSALSEARPYLERALAIREMVYGEEDPRTATSLDTLGGVLQEQRAYQEARPYYERALAIREEALGEEHPDTISSLNDLANLLHQLGANQDARLLHERALAIREKVLGPEHPNVAQSLNNLAVLLNGLGDHEGARLLHERALAIREKALGEEHPDTAFSLNGLGYLLQTQGAYQEARLLHERALAIREKVRGPEHLETAYSLHNLAYVLIQLGSLHYDEARTLCKRALLIYENVLSPEDYLTTEIHDYLRYLASQSES